MKNRALKDFEKLKSLILDASDKLTLICQIRIAVGIFIFTFIVGVIGIKHFEKLSLVDSVYFSIVTMATVGYGDIVPRTGDAKIFVTVFVLCSILAMYYMATLVLSLLVSGQLFSVLGRQKMQKDIKKMDKHVIVCGCGKVGLEIIKMLIGSNKVFVVIDKDQSILDKLAEKHICTILGDATEDDVLKEAQIYKAMGVLTCLPNDALNVYVTLAAKNLNSDIRVVAKAERAEAEKKLLAAGAERVALPTITNARVMYSSLLQPDLVDWLGAALDFANYSLAISPMILNKKSPIVGKTIGESRIKKDHSVMIISIKRDNKLINAPSGHEQLTEGDILMMVGTTEDIQNVKKMAVA